MPYAVEHVIQVWDDKHDNRVEVGPDRDGLDLVEIRQYDDAGKITQSISMTEERANLLADAIKRLYGREE